MNPPLWVVLISTVLSGFFGLLSYSLRAYRRAQLPETLEGLSGKRRTEAIERHLTGLRLTASLCRVLCTLVLVVAMLYLFDALRGGLARTVGAAAAAAAIIAVFGVAIPYACASLGGGKVLSSTLGVLLFCRYLFYPITAVMQALDVAVRRLAGRRDQEPEDLAKQEILQATSEGQAEGAVDAEEARMIASVIEFGDTCASEIMTPRTDIFAIPADTPWREACGIIFEAGHTRVPVYQDDLDNIIGILYAKDLLQHVESAAPVSVRRIMRKCFFVPETKLLDDLLREFKARKVHLAVVLDEYGGTAGLVTIEDVLEEIVGDISDEYDRPAPALMHRVDEKTAEVDGRMYIDDLNDAMGLKIPEDADYDTVAGFVFSELGYIPAAGEKLRAHGARFTVLAADERKITSLRVELTEDARQDAEDL